MGKKNRESEVDAPDMSIEEAKAYRASLAKPAVVKLTEQQRRDAFRVFWAKEKYAYGQPKKLEEIIWLHLKSLKMDDPSKFEDGIKNFGLKKIS